MSVLFLACAVIGGVVILLQLALGLLGHDSEHDSAHAAADGLQLLSIRTASAGLAFFGIAGRVALAMELGPFIAFAVAIPVAIIAAIAVAAAMRQLARFESDGLVNVEGAIGLTARVHVSVPGRRTGAGKVMLTLQGRLVELRAITADDTISSGSKVFVLDVVDGDTVEVATTSILGDL